MFYIMVYYDSFIRKKGCNWSGSNANIRTQQHVVYSANQRESKQPLKITFHTIIFCEQNKADNILHFVCGCKDKTVVKIKFTDNLCWEEHVS